MLDKIRDNVKKSYSSIVLEAIVFILGSFVYLQLL